jgi:large subunit ribosomal protein L22
MAKGHRSQIKRERNANTDNRAKAKVSFARVSDTKARIVLDTIKGKDVVSALGILAFTPRKAARVIEKLLSSAVANAENNLGLDPNNLYIQETFANKGPTLKRIRPRAQGRAFRIQKRTSHITIILNER